MLQAAAWAKVGTPTPEKVAMVGNNSARTHSLSEARARTCTREREGGGGVTDLGEGGHADAGAAEGEGRSAVAREAEAGVQPRHLRPATERRILVKC
jgi:hypothetical protein